MAAGSFKFLSFSDIALWVVGCDFANVVAAWRANILSRFRNYDVELGILGLAPDVARVGCFGGVGKCGISEAVSGG